MQLPLPRTGTGMNGLPVVTICRADGGHKVACSCGWHSFRFARHDADRLAQEHRASHGKDSKCQ